jgi:hypothetical protein
MKRRTALVAAIVLMLAAAFPTAAQAAPPGNGNETFFIGPDLNSTYQSHEHVFWDDSTGQVSQDTTGYNMTSGWCVSLYFDWQVLWGHHDARATRDCTSGGGNGNGTWYDNSYLTIGVNRMGACYDADNHVNGCVAYTGTNIDAIPKNWNISSGIDCISWVKRYTNGTAVYNSGGDERSCTN